MAENVSYEISLRDLFSSKIKEAEHNANHFEGTLNKTHKGLEVFGSKISDLGKQIAGAFLAFEAASFIKESSKAFIDSEAATKRLSLALSAKGGLSSDLKDLLNQSEELEKKGIFSHESTKQAEISALQFGFNANQIKKIVPIVEDFAAATGQSSEEAMNAVLRGSSGMIRGLKLYGIHLKDTGSKSKNLDIILSQLTQKFKDQNEIIAQTTEAGKIANLTNQWQAFKETLGADFLKVFDMLLPYLKESMEIIKNSIQWLKEHREQIKTISVFLGSMFLAYKVLFIIDKIKTLMQGLTIAQYALNLAMSLSPIGAMTIAIGLIATAWFHAYEQHQQYLDSINIRAKSAIDLEITAVQQLADGYIALGEAKDIALVHAITTQKESISNQLAEERKKLRDIMVNEDEGFWTGVGKANLKHIGINIDTERDKRIFGIQQMITNLMAQEQALKDKGIFKKTPAGKPMKNESIIDESTSNITGQKYTNININITKLVEKLSIMPQTLKEGVAQIQDEIVKALTTAVEDAQIIGGQ